MKKEITFALAALLITSQAIAHTINVPFFADSSTNTPGGGITSGYVAYIGVMNTTSNPIVLNIVYQQNDSNGDSQTMTPQQYTLGPHRGISWRPHKGNGSVPTADQALPPFGNARIIWSGGDNGLDSLTGRYVQLGSQGEAFSHILVQE